MCVCVYASVCVRVYSARIQPLFVRNATDKATLVGALVKLEREREQERRREQDRQRELDREKETDGKRGGENTSRAQSKVTCRR